MTKDKARKPPKVEGQTGDLVITEALDGLGTLAERVRASQKPFVDELNRVLASLVGHDRGSVSGNKLIVAQVNEARKLLGMGLFLEDGTRVSLSCVDTSDYEHGRFDAKESRGDQKVHYSKEFPRLIASEGTPRGRRK